MHPYFNPLSAEFREDPYRFYRELRENDPYYYSPFGFFAVTRDADIRAVLGDKRYGRDFMDHTPQAVGNPAFLTPVIKSTRNWMLFRDPPDHTRLRGLVAKGFSARSVLDLRPRIEEIVDEALDGLKGRSRIDVVADFAGKIPSAVICELLGVPQKDREMVRKLGASLLRLIDPVPLTPADLAHLGSQHSQMTAYLAPLFEERRREPRDDLLSRLVEAEEAGDHLSPAERTDNVLLLLAAGFDTTEGMIGNALLALMGHREQLAMLYAEQSRMSGAVEEFLRFDSSVQFTSRTALEEIRLGDATVPPGMSVVCVLGSANRDPAVHHEPDRFDVTRTDPRPFSFGGGIHYCLGATLAKLEIEIAVGRFIARFPEVRLDAADKPERRQTMTVRAFARLPVLL